jgi:hypothetical protein
MEVTAAFIFLAGLGPIAAQTGSASNFQLLKISPE